MCCIRRVYFLLHPARIDPSVVSVFDTFHAHWTYTDIFCFWDKLLISSFSDVDVDENIIIFLCNALNPFTLAQRSHRGIRAPCESVLHIHHRRRQRWPFFPTASDSSTISLCTYLHHQHGLNKIIIYSHTVPICWQSQRQETSWADSRSSSSSSNCQQTTYSSTREILNMIIVK